MAWLGECGFRCWVASMGLPAPLDASAHLHVEPHKGLAGRVCSVVYVAGWLPGGAPIGPDRASVVFAVGQPPGASTRLRAPPSGAPIGMASAVYAARWPPGASGWSPYTATIIPCRVASGRPGSREAGRACFARSMPLLPTHVPPY